MQHVFINLTVKDVEESMNFYIGIGFTINPKFSDDRSKCMTWSEVIFIMIMSYKKFKSFIKKPIGDSKKSLISWFAFSVESLERLNGFMESGLKAGGIESIPLKDDGFMQLGIRKTWIDIYGRFFMDTAKIPNQD